MLRTRSWVSTQYRWCSRVDCLSTSSGPLKSAPTRGMLRHAQVLAIGDRALADGGCMWSVDNNKYNVCFFPCHRCAAFPDCSCSMGTELNDASSASESYKVVANNKAGNRVWSLHMMLPKECKHCNVCCLKRCLSSSICKHCKACCSSFVQVEVASLTFACLGLVGITSATVNNHAAQLLSGDPNTFPRLPTTTSNYGLRCVFI